MAATLHSSFFKGFLQFDVNEGDIIQGFIVAEKTLVFEVTEFSVVDGLIALLASYYTFHVNYPKSTPALSLMLFLQEQVMGMPDYIISKKPARYKACVNLLKKALRASEKAAESLGPIGEDEN